MPEPAVTLSAGLSDFTTIGVTPMYLRNRPVDRDEVVIRDYQILTLPAEVCPPDRDDRYGWPTVIQGLVEPLFNEIKAEGEAALRDLKTHMVNEKMPTLGSH